MTNREMREKMDKEMINFLKEMIHLRCPLRASNIVAAVLLTAYALLPGISWLEPFDGLCGPINLTEFIMDVVSLFSAFFLIFEIVDVEDDEDAEEENNGVVNDEWWEGDE